MAPAYNVGSIVAVGATIELGEGDDQALGGSGDDFISGGPGNDGVAGGPGNDTVLGGEGAFDAVDFPGSVGMPTFGLQAYDPTAGTDRVDGGPGHDQVGGLEGTISGPTPFGGCCAIVGLEPSLVRPDVITCGDPTDDVAFYGPSDQVNIDCEQLIQVVPCPKGGCDGVVTIYATVPSPGGSTATASGRKKRRVTVGKARLKGSGGFLPAVQIRLSEKRLSRVLGGRQRAPGETVTRLKAGKKGKKSGATTAAGKKFRIAGRTRFVFTKG